MSKDTTTASSSSTTGHAAEPLLSESENELVTLRSLVHLLRERGMLETTFVEVLPGEDEPRQSLH